MLARLPLTTSLLYLAVARRRPARARAGPRSARSRTTKTLEQLTEIVVCSRCSPRAEAGAGLRRRRWRLPLRLAFVSMVVTVALIAVVGVLGLGLPLGAAVLLGAILAPTDPVLASDVQVAKPDDRDRLRFGLTGEAGLNDGTAFPFVHARPRPARAARPRRFGWRWLAVDVLWAVVAGVAIGAVLGTAVGQLVLYLRRTHREAVGLDDFLALGLIALAYGAALLAHAYGFLAVFAAGLALRRSSGRLAAKAAGGAPDDAEQGCRAATGAAEVSAEAHADPDASHAEQVATDPKPRRPTWPRPCSASTSRSSASARSPR